MQKTTLEEWKIIREEPVKPYLTHSIYEGDNSEFAFYFSQIEEWSLMKHCTKLQIYTHKSSPEKIYDSGSVWFLFDIFDETDLTETSFIFDWTLEKLVCFRQLINKGNNNYSYPFIIINLSNLTYAAIDDNLLNTLKKDDSISVTGVKAVIDKDTKEEKKVFENFKFEEMKWSTLTKLTNKTI
jgi:hypothetical protein